MSPPKGSRPDPSPKERELLQILAQYTDPQPEPVLARIIRYCGGAKSPSVVGDRLGTLRKKGFVQLIGRDWRITDQGKDAVSPEE